MSGGDGNNDDNDLRSEQENPDQNPIAEPHVVPVVADQESGGDQAAPRHSDEQQQHQEQEPTVDQQAQRAPESVNDLNAAEFRELMVQLQENLEQAQKYGRRDVDDARLGQEHTVIFMLTFFEYRSHRPPRPEPAPRREPQRRSTYGRGLTEEEDQQIDAMMKSGKRGYFEGRRAGEELAPRRDEQQQQEQQLVDQQVQRAPEGEPGVADGQVGPDRDAPQSSGNAGFRLFCERLRKNLEIALQVAPRNVPLDNRRFRNEYFAMKFYTKYYMYVRDRERALGTVSDQELKQIVAFMRDRIREDIEPFEHLLSSVIREYVDNRQAVVRARQQEQQLEDQQIQQAKFREYCERVDRLMEIIDQATVWKKDIGRMIQEARVQPRPELAPRRDEQQQQQLMDQEVQRVPEGEYRTFFARYREDLGIALQVLPRNVPLDNGLYFRESYAVMHYTRDRILLEEREQALGPALQREPEPLSSFLRGRTEEELKQIVNTLLLVARHYVDNRQAVVRARQQEQQLEDQQIQELAPRRDEQQQQQQQLMDQEVQRVPEGEYRTFFARYREDLEIALQVLPQNVPLDNRRFFRESYAVLHYTRDRMLLEEREQALGPALQREPEPLSSFLRARTKEELVQMLIVDTLLSVARHYVDNRHAVVSARQQEQQLEDQRIQRAKFREYCENVDQLMEEIEQAKVWKKEVAQMIQEARVQPRPELALRRDEQQQQQQQLVDQRVQQVPEGEYRTFLARYREDLELTLQFAPRNVLLDNGQFIRESFAVMHYTRDRMLLEEREQASGPALQREPEPLSSFLRGRTEEELMQLRIVDTLLLVATQYVDNRRPMVRAAATAAENGPENPNPSNAEAGEEQ